MKNPFTVFDVVVIFTAGVALRLCIEDNLSYLLTAMLFGFCYGTLKAYLGE